MVEEMNRKTAKGKQKGQNAMSGTQFHLRGEFKVGSTLREMEHAKRSPLQIGYRNPVILF
jgi:hypothetical protein